MKTLPALVALLWSIATNAPGENYSPTAEVGEFLRKFERAYTSGDSEWILGAVDKEGVHQEAQDLFLSILGPKDGGETISGLAVTAAPADFKVANTLLDYEIEASLPIDFILTFRRTLGGLETTIKVPAGYRNGKIRLAGIRKK